MRHIYFVLFPGCEILDFAGPVQALHEARSLGVPLKLHYCASTESVLTAQGMEIGALEPLPAVTAGDWIFVPGFPVSTASPVGALTRWLRDAAPTGARLCSVCTGAFALGDAGLLDGRRCTTHWRRIAELQARFPRAKVMDDRLYIEDGPIMTSAGIAAGIDMTLAMLEQDYGPQIASTVAREMVVYMRRDGEHRQESIFLHYQDHLNAAVHQVQRYLIDHPTSRTTLDELAAMSGMSVRHLTRLFRQVTGISIGDFRLRLRLERAQSLMQQSSQSLEWIASECGFADARQLRRLWVRHFGSAPAAYRRRYKAAEQ